MVDRETLVAREKVAELTDGDLVAQTRAGDRDAYGRLVARYQGHVYGLAYSVVDNWAEAQDIAQEAFIRAYVNLGQLREPERFAAWLRRVAFSVTMNWLKQHRPTLFERLEGRVDLEALEIPDFRPGPPEVMERRELAEAVVRAVGALPPKYRVPLTMFHLDGLSYQKVADFLDIPLGTAKSLIHRARAKLKEALASYVEEVGPMVQEVFDEHKLPAEFAQRVLAGVPTLSWGTGRDCTFAGALAAALAATDHPYTYSDIMGFTGLAFRTRWFCGNETQRWCPSCAVGEMEEEIAAAAKATGWPLRFTFLEREDAANVERLTGEIVGSIDRGLPVLAYEPGLNMDVVYGYEERGKALLLRDYSRSEESYRLSTAELGFLVILLGEHGEGMPRREATIEGLGIAVHNWRRERAAAGPGEYWYGATAFERWIADIGEAGEFSEEERSALCGVSWWNSSTLCDARRAGVTFLRESAELLGGRAGEALGRAAAIVSEEARLLGEAMEEEQAFPRSAEQWTPQVRQREQEVLTKASALDGEAVGEIESALREVESGGT